MFQLTAHARAHCTGDSNLVAAGGLVDRVASQCHLELKFGATFTAYEVTHANLACCRKFGHTRAKLRDSRVTSNEQCELHGSNANS